jgi:lipid A 3-O-deacylase
MTRFVALVIVATVLGALGSSQVASAFDAEQTFHKGAFILSVEGAYGEQFNLEGKRQFSGLEFFNGGVRFSLLPFGTAGPGFLRGALEIGLEPIYQRYTEPVDAFFAGLAAVGRYHFLSLGRFVPYLELAGAAGGTDLRVREIRSDFAFLLFGGVGASVFLTDTAAVYAGYRYEHVSNGGTERPNRGFEAHVGVIGLSFFLR